MDWRQWLYLFFTGGMAGVLYIYMAYLWGNRDRRERIERGGLVPLNDNRPLNPQD